MSIRELNVGKYLFHFFHQVDINRVLDGAPWMFDNQLFLLHQLKEGEILNQPSINNVEFWVQIHDIPVDCMSMAIGQ